MSKIDFSRLYLEEESHTIAGAAMNLHSALGCGFLEALYQEGAIVFGRRSSALLFEGDGVKAWNYFVKNCVICEI